MASTAIYKYFLKHKEDTDFRKMMFDLDAIARHFENTEVYRYAIDYAVIILQEIERRQINE